MQRPSLARWLVVGAFAAMGLFWGASAYAQETSIQGQNGASDATGISGDVSSSNTLTFSGGATSTAGGGGPAQSSLNGDTSGSVNQGAKASSADAAAGSQVTGCVGGCKVQAQNSSDGDTAISGNADASNTAAITLGPNASSTGAPAQSSQTGDDVLRLVQWTVAASGDAVAGSQVTGVVGDGATIQSQNASEDALAVSGNACASFVCGAGNDLFANLGPGATSDGLQAQAGQVGDNDAALTQSAGAWTGDAVAGSQIAGSVGVGDSKAQNQNASDAPLAVSGDAFASNLAVVVMGPSAFASTIAGGGSAQAGQTGDNSAEVDQRSESTSGDAVAGSQVTGLVNEERGHIEVQNQQSSDDDTAISGIATSDNTALVIAGPGATALSGLEDASAQAGQTGDNTVEIEQRSEATTGDALAGAQVSGVVSEAEGSASVRGQNASEDALSVSGPADASNLTVVASGPSAFALTDATATELFACLLACDANALAVAGDANAQAAHFGDTDADVRQDAVAGSGDALAGSQVWGAVVSTRGDATLQGQNASDGDNAFSGGATALNVSTVLAGPNAFATSVATADALAVCLVGCNATSVALAGDADAQASMDGDIAVRTRQDSLAGSGDAVAGSQVGGAVVSDHGQLDVSAQNASDASLAVSGDSDATNLSTVDAGPTSTADASAEATSTALCLAGCAASATSVADDAVAMASLDGDIAADVTQVSDAQTGDAVAGAQVTGSVISSGTATVQLQGDADDAIAISGDADVLHDSTLQAGPSADADSTVSSSGFAACLAGCTANGVATSDTATAQASQDGDTALRADQAGSATSGDAVAGGQIAGVVADRSDVTVQDQLATEDALATSGDAATTGIVTLVAGPAATADSGATGDAIASCGVGCFAVAAASGNQATAQSSQDGDNSMKVEAAVEAATGDALAGASVTGVVADSEVAVQHQNSADAPTALSGDADAVAILTAEAGPVADADASALASAIATGALAGNGTATAVSIAAAGATGGPANAQASQTGDNALRSEQAAGAWTGDALAGAQVTGVVADGAGVRVAMQDASEDAFAVSGDSVSVADAVMIAGPEADADASAAALATSDAVATAIETDACVFARCTVDAGATAVAVGAASATGGDADAQASQHGDNDLRNEQAVSAATGDALAGAQVTGVVASGNADVTVQGQDASDDALAVSGNADALAVATLTAGPVSTADGSALALADATADAFAAATAVCAIATCDVTATAVAVGVATSTATGSDADVQASQDGDNDLAADQAVSSTSGDAVAGSQVTGVVADGWAHVTVTTQNDSDTPVAVSGDADTVSTVTLDAGPRATGDSSAASFAGASASASAVAFAGCILATCDVSAAAVGVAVAGAAATADETTAASQQDGDNAILAAQGADADTGDAVAGSQVTGVVAGGHEEVLVAAQNFSEDPFSLTGDASASNDLVAQAGPVALSDGSAFASGSATAVAAAAAACRTIAVGCTNTDLDVDVDVDVETVAGFAADTQAAQDGDNTIVFDQDAQTSTGDAVAGSQITGVIAGDPTVQVQNFDEGSIALSGAVDAANFASGGLGPVAFSFDGLASSQQAGDSELDGAQSVWSASGDGVAGSQINGLVVG